ncbi:hypothetical protein SLEP1_g30337 [Rubroshorea leprosula]|uniref:Uncharacterized protein n=1 Tax=Rubroshorea leprosula TaxID=152421 RepID=A0AAV5K8E5_9ROSI|nr:hypothetical protein SLEP1_g30337 [Rubroshorea leprosula]
MAKLALREAATYHNSPAVETGPSMGKKPAAVQGRNSRIYPKLKEIRAIKVNPSQFKQEQRKLGAVLTENSKQFAPIKQEQPADKRGRTEQIRISSKGKDFWVPRGGSYRSRSPGYLGAARRVRRQRAQSSRGRGAGSVRPRPTRFDERPPPAPQSRGPSNRGSSSSSRPRADHRVEMAAPGARRRTREETESEEDEVPLARRIRSGGTQPAQAARPTTVRSPGAPSATAQMSVEPDSASASSSGPRITYPEGFSYTRAECQPAMLQTMRSFVPPTDNRRAKAFVQQHGGQVAMIKLMDAFNYTVALYESDQAARTQNSELSSKCKLLAAEKASLVDDVNRLQGSEMANRAAAAESRADELANKINELTEELERARVERESGIQAAKDEAARVEERAKKAEADRDHAQHELGSLR